MSTDPRAIYDGNLADEIAGTPRPSPLRALGLSAVHLERICQGGAELGAAVRIMIARYLEVEGMA